MSIISLSNAAQREIRLFSPGILRAFDETYRRHKGHGRAPQFPLNLFNIYRLTPERISTFRCRNSKRSNSSVDYDDFIADCRATALPHKNRATVTQEVIEANYLAECALADYTADERKDIAGALWNTSKGITINGITLTIQSPSYMSEGHKIKGEIARLDAPVIFQKTIVLLLNALPHSIIEGMNANMPLPGKLIDLPWGGRERILFVENLEGTQSTYTQITFANHDPWTGTVLA